jgi:hypothetical protein
MRIPDTAELADFVEWFEGSDSELRDALAERFRVTLGVLPHNEDTVYIYPLPIVVLDEERRVLSWADTNRSTDVKVAVNPVLFQMLELFRGLDTERPRMELGPGPARDRNGIAGRGVAGEPVERPAPRPAAGPAR